jgi:photosystem II stability/assembly factor-like uncharacterized protein
LGIKFFADGVGYIGLDSGPLLKTIDGGIHFTDLPLEYVKPGMQVHFLNQVPDFINSKEGYNVFQFNCLYHTTDGGNNWVELITDSTFQNIMSK